MIKKHNLKKCPKCSHLLKEHWENNGFDEPEGPSKWEVSYLYCPDCGYKED
jgi:DNA-directed RNA polymerase subunit RPC12/RpoP